MTYYWRTCHYPRNRRYSRKWFFNTYPEALRPHEAAKALGVTTEQLRKWAKEGRIRAIRIGKYFRYPIDEIVRIIEEGMEAAVSPTVKPVNVVTGKFEEGVEEEEIEEVSVVETGEVKAEEGVPSFLIGNKWLEILAKRGRE